MFPFEREAERLVLKCSITFKVKVQPIFYQIESLGDRKRHNLDNSGVLLGPALTSLI